MLISRRILTKDKSSLHLMVMHLTIWKDHVEGFLYLEVRNNPTWEGGSVETQRSAQSRSVVIRCGDHDRISISWQDCFCRQDTHSQYTSVQYSLFTSAERTGNALGSTADTAQELHCHLCALAKSLVIWCVSCLIHGCSLTRLHSLFLLPRHKNTKHNQYNKNYSENTQYITHISKIPQSTSCAIKNHSGEKTCRVAETRARQLPQDLSPKSLRVSRGSKIILEIHINCMMFRKIWRRRSPSSDHRRSEGIWRNWNSRLIGF